MIKFSTAAVLIGLCVSTQVAWAGTPDYLNSGAAYVRAQHLQDRDADVQADGRCDGVSYGTGARRCGTATGGPAGGITGRN